MLSGFLGKPDKIEELQMLSIAEIANLISKNYYRTCQYLIAAPYLNEINDNCQKIIQVWFILFTPFFALKLYRLYNTNNNFEEQYNKTRKMYKGSKFRIDKYVDTSRNIAKLDLNKSEFTVVDFWFSEYRPVLKT